MAPGMAPGAPARTQPHASSGQRPGLARPPNGPEPAGYWRTGSHGPHHSFTAEILLNSSFRIILLDPYLNQVLNFFSLKSCFLELKFAPTQSLDKFF